MLFSPEYKRFVLVVPYWACAAARVEQRVDITLPEGTFAEKLARILYWRLYRGFYTIGEQV